ncbi:MAG: hypothetical protein ACYTGN_09340 [Planctomycetota bacterium]
MNKTIAYLAIVCMVLLSVDVLIHKHVHFEFEDIGGFHGWVAFLGAGGLALLAVPFGALVRQREDYYDDA